MSPASRFSRFSTVFWAIAWLLAPIASQQAFSQQTVDVADPSGRLIRGLPRPGAPIPPAPVRDETLPQETVDTLDTVPTFSRRLPAAQDVDPDDLGQDAISTGVPLDGSSAQATIPAPVDGDLSRAGQITDGQIDLTQTPVATANPDDEFDTFTRQRRPRPTQLRGAFDPTGIRYGSFIFLPEAVLDTRLTDNLFLTKQNKRSDVALELRPTLRIISDWNRHEVEVTGTGLRSYYREFSSENDANFDLRARGRLDIRRRSNVEGEVFTTFAQESRGSIDVPNGVGDRPNQRTHGARATLNHRFNRLSVRLRGQIQDNDFEPGTDTVTTGAVTTTRSLDDRDYVERDVTLRGSYEFSPALTAFAEGEVNQRDYETPRDLAGFNRDSDGYRFRAGIQFDNGSKLRGEVSVGYGSQSPDDARLRTVDGVLFDGNLEWRPNEDTTVRLTASSEIRETTVANSAGASTNQVGLEVRHAMRRYLLLTAAADYQHEDFSGIDLSEDQLTGRVELEYLFNQEVALLARYQHTKFMSDQSLRDYNENELRLGVRVRR